ncbi:MAG: thermonuclease family protein [Phycisphaeraceae bacterium]|nr:thermonuclease family protein [Phycisphaeraceae bacterium]
MSRSVPQSVRWSILALTAGLAIGFFAGRLSIPVDSVSSGPKARPVEPVAIPMGPNGPAQPEPSSKPASEDQEGLQVGRIIDGDTLEVRYRPDIPLLERVRLLRIDTPERGEPGYAEAKAELDLLMNGHKARVEFEDGKPQRDRFGRLLAYIHAGQTMVNLEMVRRGWSRHETRFGTGKYKQQFEAAESEARRNKRGLWGMESNN